MAGPKPYASHVAIPLPNDGEIRRILGSSTIRQGPERGQDVRGYRGHVRCHARHGARGLRYRRCRPRLRQAIILRAATVLDVPYEWQANVPMSRNNGLSEADTESIGTLGGELPQAYALVCTATDRSYHLLRVYDSGA